MTADKARKEEIRERMAQTGEPYSVARRALSDEPAPGSHLISDDETRRIVEAFLSCSPWYGDTVWGGIVIGPGAEHLRVFDGNYRVPGRLAAGQRWSWCVAFLDPGGDSRELHHELVLQGVRDLLYGDCRGEANAVLRAYTVREWFVTPAVKRRDLVLSDGDASRICQQALYGRQIFVTDDEADQAGTAVPSAGTSMRDSPEGHDQPPSDQTEASDVVPLEDFGKPA